MKAFVHTYKRNGAPVNSGSHMKIRNGKLENKVTTVVCNKEKICKTHYRLLVPRLYKSLFQAID